MAFLETPVFGDDLAREFTGGPALRTEVVVTASGHEVRNRRWQQARRRWDAASCIDTLSRLAYIEDLFLTVGGQADGFRLRDWGDYTATVANGLLQAQVASVDYGSAGSGYGLPAYQLVKRYTRGALTHDRQIRKPRSPITVYRNGVAIAPTIDYATGQVTLAADALSAATAITVGATTQVTLTTNPGTLVAGQRLYLSGFTGADAASVNGLSHLINSVSGAGPFVFTLATDTTGETITLGAGLGAKYAQASESLTWAGYFDVPVRFNIDDLDRSLMVKRPDGDFIVQFRTIPIIEIRA